MEVLCQWSYFFEVQNCKCVVLVDLKPKQKTILNCDKINFWLRHRKKYFLYISTRHHDTRYHVSFLKERAFSLHKYEKKNPTSVLFVLHVLLSNQSITKKPTKIS